jgi:hypothetical protein
MMTLSQTNKYKIVATWNTHHGRTDHLVYVFLNVDSSYGWKFIGRGSTHVAAGCLIAAYDAHVKLTRERVFEFRTSASHAPILEEIHA